jgi:hypothetical protein
MSEEVETLRSGLVIAGAYADKLRRVAFAQLKNRIKEGVISAKDVAYHVAQLNKLLYKILVETLKIDKGDVVRISINYRVAEGRIEWDFASLKIEVFRRVPQEEVDEAVRKVVERAGEVIEETVSYKIEKIGETEDGDMIFVMKLGDSEVGAFEVIQVDSDFAYIKKGAATDPSPMIIEKVRIPLEGGDIETAIANNIDKLTEKAKYVSLSEANRVIEYIKKRVIERTEETPQEMGE